MVIIKFGPVEAKINNREWTCRVEVIEKMLNDFTKGLKLDISPADGEPDYVIAREIIEYYGGKVVDSQYDKYPEGAVF